MKILFLDDDFSRVEEFESKTGLKVHHVLTGEDFCLSLMENKYDLIMLDHDLGLVDWDGSRAAKFLAENRLFVGDDQTVIIHSANSVGVANMMSHMKHADHLNVSVVHFAWAKVKMVDGRLHFEI